MQHDSILTVDEVAALLHCTPETVRERTPRDIPGTKFGRDWVYAHSAVVQAVIDLSRKPAQEKAKFAGLREVPPPLRRKRSAPALPDLVRQFRAAQG